MIEPRSSRRGLSAAVAVAAMLGLLALPDAKGHYAGASVTTDPTPWRSHLRAADDAIARNDGHAGMRAWQAGYGTALGSRAWDGMVEVADAYISIGDAIPAWAMARTRARAMYLTALFRARQQRSLDGVLACVEAFAALGDRDVVVQGLRIAESLATDPLARERVYQRRVLLAADRMSRMGAF